MIYRKIYMDKILPFIGKPIIKAELLNCLAASDADFSVMELFAQIGKCVFGFWKELSRDLQLCLV